ncbi:MAG: alpha/beta hydrolase [Proteobacteria bacterium]|jgi:pimeloyl-ACP methyl ester carboxylesterase|nr:alpha/beta hydrolase [Pseudomonadota bacterium]
MRSASSLFVDLRGERHHVLTWGHSGAPVLILVHGWMDVAASFQFLVDALTRDWYVVAPDLRGFGRSAWQPQGYWFPDYVADLDALVRHFAGGEPARLVGHSLGGNVVMHYAGVRPRRVARVVSLEGFGIPEEGARKAPEKLGAWLDALEEPPAFRPYASLAAVADRLQKNNPRLARDRAEFLAAHWARVRPDGSADLVSDPRHRLPFPTVNRMEEAFAVWRAIEAPVLWVAAADSRLPHWLDGHPEGEVGTGGLAGVRRRLAAVPHGRLGVIDDAGHMLHHDQPAAVAAQIEPFLVD